MKRRDFLRWGALAPVVAAVAPMVNRLGGAVSAPARLTVNNGATVTRQPPELAFWQSLPRYVAEPLARLNVPLDGLAGRLSYGLSTNPGGYVSRQFSIFVGTDSSVWVSTGKEWLLALAGRGP